MELHQPLDEDDSAWCMDRERSAKRARTRVVQGTRSEIRRGSEEGFMTKLESLAGLLSLLASTCLTGTQAQPRSMSWRVESSTASAQSSLHILVLASS